MPFVWWDEDHRTMLHLHHLLGYDRTVAEVLDLARGECATRDRVVRDRGASVSLSSDSGAPSRV
ncbi:hypothetical protein WEH80_01950 [Actinomycetes bacterium KLBMP 9759]